MNVGECNKLLIYGGSFDPPHIAHVALPRIVMQAIGADAVAYVPTAQQPLKRDRVQTPAADRLAMLRLALRDEPWAIIVTDEIDRGGVSYTVDTLEGLRARMKPGATMRLLIGTDQLRIFHKWRAADRIVELAEPAVMLRPPDTVESVLRELPAGFDADMWRQRMVTTPVMDVSSTMVREKAARGEGIEEFVGQAVAGYVREKSLYR